MSFEVMSMQNWHVIHQENLSLNTILFFASRSVLKLYRIYWGPLNL